MGCKTQVCQSKQVLSDSLRSACVCVHSGLGIRRRGADLIGDMIKMRENDDDHDDEYDDWECDQITLLSRDLFPLCVSLDLLLAACFEAD